MTSEGYSRGLPVYTIPLMPHEVAPIIDLFNRMESRACGAVNPEPGKRAYGLAWRSDGAALHSTFEEDMPREHFYSSIRVCKWLVDVSWERGTLLRFDRRRAIGKCCQTVLSITRIRGGHYSVIFEDHQSGTYSIDALDKLLPMRMVRLALAPSVPNRPNAESELASAIQMTLETVEGAVADIRFALDSRTSAADISPATGWEVTHSDPVYKCANPRFKNIELFLSGTMPGGIALLGINNGANKFFVFTTVADALAGRWVVHASAMTSATTHYVLHEHPFANWGGADMRWVIPPVSHDTHDVSERSLVVRGAEDVDLD